MTNQLRPEWQRIGLSILGWTFKFLCAVTVISFTVIFTVVGAAFGVLRKTR